ncbi:hypothetical protein FQZ97_1132530 [compost metagenome]
MSVDFDIENIDISKFLEKDSLALHYGLGCERADIAETENGRTVGNDCYQIAARRIFGSSGRIFMDCQARGRDARRVGKR